MSDDSFILNVLIFITGGKALAGEAFADVIDYDPDENKWTKVGQLAMDRYKHGMSIVPKETVDYCA